MVRSARRRAGLTQRELAVAVEIAQSSIARIESGSVAPRTTLLMRILRATGHELTVTRRLGDGVAGIVIDDLLRREPVDRVRLAIAEWRAVRSRRRSDPVRLMRRLRRYGVRFVLMGALAARARGAPVRAEGAMEICPAPDPENLARLASVLDELRAVHRDPPRKRPNLDHGKTFELSTDAGDLDIIGIPIGTDGFADLDSNASALLVAEGLIVRTADVDDLIRMKRPSRLPRDRADLEVLGALRDALDG